MTDLSNPSVFSFLVTPLRKGFTVELRQGGQAIAKFEGKPVSFEQAHAIGEAMASAAYSQRRSP